MELKVMEDGSMHIIFSNMEHSTQIELLEKLFEVFDNNDDIQEAIIAVSEVVAGVNKPLN